MKAVLFDLDYTLYDTDKYVMGAFQDVTKYLVRKHKLSQKKIYQHLIKLWNKKTSAYPYLFNDLLEHLSLKNENVDTIVEIFNKHETGSFQLYPDTIPTLKRLRLEDFKLGIITDGDATRQRRKILEFGLEKLVDNITYAKNLEPKPSSLPFTVALKKLNVKPSSAIYVADNPSIDFKGAAKIGMKTARILRGRFAKIILNDYVDYTIKNLDEIFKILKSK